MPFQSSHVKYDFQAICAWNLMSFKYYVSIFTCYQWKPLTPILNCCQFPQNGKSILRGLTSDLCNWVYISKEIPFSEIQYKGIFVKRIILIIGSKLNYNLIFLGSVDMAIVIYIP